MSVTTSSTTPTPFGENPLSDTTPEIVSTVPIHIRPDWDEYGLGLAKAASVRADCTRRKVGAVLMASDHSIVATGYNGGPSKGLSCLEGECPRGLLSHSELAPDSPYDKGAGLCISLHAEWNVMLRASWEQLNGSTLYVTTEPCHICKNLINGTNISKVMWPEGVWYRTTPPPN